MPSKQPTLYHGQHNALLLNMKKEVTTHIVVTESDKQTIDREGLQILVVPLYEWLLK